MKKVLVFPCGSEIGLELHRCLSHTPHFELWGAASVDDHGAFTYENYEGSLPMIADAAFLPAFNRLVDRLGIEYVFPAHDEVLVALARWRAGGRLHAEVVAPDRDTCDLCRSKSATYRRFADTLAVPKMYSPDEAAAAAYPLFVKPDAGQGSRGASRVDDPAAAAEAMRNIASPLLLQYLPGCEYTVDCFSDRHGRLRFLSGRERRRVSGGISVHCRGVDKPAFASMGETINRALNLRGAWFFQVRDDARGNPVLLEIAPRIAGSSGFQRARGVNLALLSLYDRMGLDVEIDPVDLPGLEMDRALANAFRLDLDFEAVYIDYDDTLVLDDRVDPRLVAFIFQCLNRGVRVNLLTRHDGDLAEDLRRRRLSGLFDALIRVPPDRPKSLFIGERKAILIDDSFSERLEVSRSLGIPVFDPASAEALFHAVWRR